ncbi:MAG: efflux RND transporter periplasmic adaptor subunit [Bacteroidales bacterium]|nr:efflux RND transporter periplasmic adaptor subunit [Bacteroidales bacterium]
MKKIKLTGIFFIALAIGLTSCGKSEKTDSKAEKDIPNVRVQQVNSQAVDQMYDVTATVQPQVKNSIAPSSPGRISKILVEVGNYVSKGQKLVQMDVVNLSNLETQIENYRRIYNRTKELFGVGGASQQELDNAKLQLDVAETNMKNLTENTYLLSPISGVITARNYDNGDMYSAQQPILTVMQINPAKLVINVSESYYSQVKTGMPVDITLDVFEGETFHGNVSLIYPVIDDKTRTFAVEIKMNNNNNKVRPGMFARVTMKFGRKERVVVPDLSIIKQSGSGARFVYVYKDGKVNLQQVEIGRRIGNNYELISGVESGSQVVVSGQSRLLNGIKVNVIK